MTNHTVPRVQKVLDRLTCSPWEFRVEPIGEMSALLYVVYWDHDTVTHEKELQVGRRWYVGPGDTENQIVQTALKACLTSAEHQVREHFKSNGVALFMPHFNARDLEGLAREYQENSERTGLRSS